MALVRTVAERSGLQRQKSLQMICIFAAGIQFDHLEGISASYREAHKKTGNPYAMDFPAGLPLNCISIGYFHQQ
ncbi:hypothetical protein DUZ99_19905 [Xylanibacillus composti]|uniref:Uncharacterized protein n=1 Tax=Xylanibacillus composti TaxID=1572762 RepID=A0A8J4M4E7_9BACL|nr:hypothetical protein [Xylanibacillus composti]MDT9727231.1 hypothetical protein [Xylanibacillus composti]GIQ71122.1 hypothetical protein XYCOK13_39460 [Xylanibacillus composti]